jgi:hypothetical protein
MRILTTTSRRETLVIGIFVALAASAGCQIPTPLVVKVSPKVIGTFSEAMSTSFQSAPWTDPAFLAHPEIPNLLTQLNPHHIRVQVIDKSIPETAPGAWDFTALDRQLQPILSAADHSPEIQLAQAPAYLYRTKTNFVTPAFIAGFADYAAKMVQHYDSPDTPHPIKYWGILNEPNYFHISPTEYVALYNAAVTAMRAVDPTIKLVALELGAEPADERSYIPIFVRRVTAPVDVIAVHFYSTCDRTVFNTIASFVQQAHSIHREMRTNPQLRDVPLWILENNVNADFVDDDGNSTCDPTLKFVEDARGTGPFFAAWRAYEFSRFGQAGIHALYHWVFAGDTQYGELNTEANPAHLQVSYWVDYWLGRYYPPTTSTEILTVTNPDPTNLEIFAVKQAGGKTIVMVCNHAVANPTDNNGKGLPRSVLVDISALGAFTSARQLTFDASTNPITGPVEKTVTIAPRMQLSLGGYGAAFLTLQ